MATTPAGAVLYSHTQSGWWALGALGVGGAGLLAAIVIVSDRRSAAASAAPTIFILGVALAILLLTAGLFSTLNVRVTSDELLWRFGPGALRFRLPLSEIATVLPARTPLWAGIGIHWIGSGWVYNVSGRDAVEITRRDGKKVWIGTGEPAVLATAIESARGGRR